MAILFTRSSRIIHRLGLKLRALQSPSVYSFSSSPSSPSLNALLSPITVARRNGQFPSILPAGSRSNNFSIKRFVSNKTEAARASTAVADCNTNQVSYFPGENVKFIAEMRFLSESPEERISCYRVLDDSGQTVSCSNLQELSEEVSLKMYNSMVTLQTMDTILYEVQRQGRISFYIPSIGEEAINIASAAALTIDDLIFPQVEKLIKV